MPIESVEELRFKRNALSLGYPHPFQDREIFVNVPWPAAAPGDRREAPKDIPARGDRTGRTRRIGVQEGSAVEEGWSSGGGEKSGSRVLDATRVEFAGRCRRKIERGMIRA